MGFTLLTKQQPERRSLSMYFCTTPLHAALQLFSLTPVRCLWLRLLPSFNCDSALGYKVSPPNLPDSCSLEVYMYLSLSSL